MDTQINDGGVGMTLRDYLAAKAMAGILSSANWGDTVSWLPQKAYAIADAMLAARKASK